VGPPSTANVEIHIMDRQSGFSMSENLLIEVIEHMIEVKYAGIATIIITKCQRANNSAVVGRGCGETVWISHRSPPLSTTHCYFTTRTHCELPCLSIASFGSGDTKELSDWLFSFTPQPNSLVHAAPHNSLR